MSLLNIYLLIFIFLPFSCQERVNHNISASNVEQSLINFSEVIGNDWENEALLQLGNQDFLGSNIEIFNHYVIGAHHSNNNLAYIRQHAVIYRNIQSAINQYNEQQEWIFVYNFGVPPSRQSSSFEELELPESTIIYADSYEVKCLQTLDDNRCIALIRYKNLIYIIDAFIVRNGEIFLDETEFVRIINLVDRSLVSLVVN
jgi:hypothetical protein